MRPLGPVWSPASVRGFDDAVIVGLGLPGVALMEVASAGLAQAVRDHHRVAAEQGTVVVCGPGNNGGDGWAAARWLHGWGIPVSVWPVVEPTTPDARTMARVARAAGVPLVDGLGGAGLVVDAVLGSGLGRPVEGPLAAVVEVMNTHRAPVVAVDVPSGFDAARGVARGACVQANRTVTLGYWKLGLFGAEAERCGALQCVDIGLGIAPRGSPPAEIPDPRTLGGAWPIRGVADHKTRSGHLLIVAGSTAMAGAAVLAATGALAAGAGLVTVAVPRAAIPRVVGLPPEVMVHVLGDGDGLPGAPDPERFQAVVAGPGLGGGAPLDAGMQSTLERWWGRSSTALLFDADALEATHAAPPSAPRVLTPHPGEAARLLASSVAEVQADRFAATSELAARGTVLLKGRHSLIGHPGAPTSINATGHPALATAGSGDVLSGVIGALLARGVSARDAARLGAWVHGIAGEQLGERQREGVRASEVAAQIPAAVATLRGGS